MKELWDFPLFKISDQAINVGQLVIALLLVSLIYLAYRQFLKQFFPKVFEDYDLEEKDKKKILKILRGLAFLVFLLAIVLALKLDYVLYSFEAFDLSIMLIIKALIFLQIVRSVDWFINNVVIHSYYQSRDLKKAEHKPSKLDEESSAKSTVKYIFYLVVGLYALKNFQIDLTFFRSNIDGNQFEFNLSNILFAILVFFIAKLVIWVFTQLLLYGVYKRNKIDVGSQYAINQLVAYVVYIFAFVIALNILGINISILLGGAAALLVGIGLGLQSTFNDFISGIVLLFERSVSVGDVLEFNGNVGTVKNIGLRASILETRGNVSMVVPNHKLVNESVINWTHYSDKVRFSINIGVAYGTDTALVKKLLLDAVKANPYVIEYPAPTVRFQSFGESALDFTIYFYSRNYMVIEDIKSDIRLAIDKSFRENKITIPFPQREITIRKVE